jgi:F-box/WD-40 domain protein MET30
MGGIFSLNFSPKFLCCGSMDGTIRVWNTCEKVTFSLRGHTDFVNAVKVDSASRTVFSGSDDCTVRLWDLDTRKCLRVFKGHVGQVQQVLPLSPEFEFDEDDFTVNDNDTDTDHDDDGDGDDASHSSHQAYNYLRRSEVGEQCTSHPYHYGRSSPPITNMVVFPDQPTRPSPPSYMLTCGLDNTIRLWHVPSGRCLRTFFGHLEGIWALAADTLRIVSGAEDRMIKIWDLRTGKCERTFTGHTGPVTCIGLSGEKLISGGDDWEIRILEFGEGGNEKYDGQNGVAA